MDVVHPLTIANAHHKKSVLIDFELVFDFSDDLSYFTFFLDCKTVLFDFEVVVDKVKAKKGLINDGETQGISKERLLCMALVMTGETLGF